MTDSQPSRVADYALGEALGRGASALVRRAVHLPTQHEVAIKIWFPLQAKDELGLRRFRHEVRVAAALEHPSIIRIFDHGILDGAPGLQPYLVMELGRAGTLRDRKGVSVWIWVRQALVTLLEALAYAHARGVLHRDIKPSNVLLGGRRTVALTDFGLAALQDDGHQDTEISGTLATMSPEQLDGRLRDAGPWSDLYSLGCTAWALVTGHFPYESSDPMALVQAHMLGQPPRLEAQTPVPPGLEGWLRKLLEREPAARFTRAADALSALDELDPRWPDEDETTEDEPTTLSDGPDRVRTERPRVEPPQRLVPDGRSPESPPLETPPGLGLALWGLRPVPMVGRQNERDRLWRALTEVMSTSQTRCIVLRGPAGIGKTRLAQWLCERCHETGVGTPFTGVHSPAGGAFDGLGPMVARALGVVGLDRAKAVVAIAEPADGPAWESVEEATLLASVVRGEAHGLPVHERWELVRRAILRKASHRVPVVWLDDVQWAPDATAFVEHVQRESRDPILFVLTVRDEDLGFIEEAEASLGRIVASGQTDVLQVGPIDAADSTAMVRGMLGLDDSLVSTLGERMGGNPLFAVQILTHWIDRQWIRATAHGFDVSPSAAFEPTADLRQVWTDRWEDMLASHPEAGPAMEAAAVLGLQVDDAEWRDMLGRLQMAVPEALLERLFEQRLAHALDDRPGWSFAHGMLRVAIEGRAVEAGRAPSLHRAASEMLASVTSTDGILRRARHRTAAGLHELAFKDLHEVASELLKLADRRIDGVLREMEVSLGHLDDPKGLHRLDYDLTHSAGRSFRSDWAGAQLDYERIDADAARFDWPASARLRVLTSRVAAYNGHGQTEESFALLKQAPELLERLEREDPAADAVLRWHVEGEIGNTHMIAGHSEEAIFHLRRAVQHMEMTPYRVKCTSALGMALSGTAEGRAEARPLLRANLATTEESMRIHLPHLLTAMGEVERLDGNIAEARGHFTHMVDVVRRQQHSYTTLGVAVINLALIDMSEGQFEHAVNDMHNLVLTDGQRVGDRTLAGLHAFQLCCHAMLGRMDRFDAEQPEVERLVVVQRRVADPDVVLWLERAGDALRSRRDARADWTFGAAQKVAEMLGDQAACERLGQKRLPPAGA